MYFILLILAIIVCILLGFIVLIQNPKGGGLSSNFSSSSQLMGVQKTGDILEKGTWVLAIALMVLSLAINVVVKSGTVKGGGGASSEYQNQIDKASKPSAPVGAAPAPTMQLTPKATDSTKK
ncbi:preprotein translocase subunit SecG [Mucilaginibacter sp. KACC 22063]|uniref:preprotein translocase subunit SecG n=1 Tax=Mucilaginibacter sp. KACC 22063 TaxID=3025666 RepID=UPI00236706F8|nr:preprotein translocase subunit SecG [Mucilaginibacter sp. KACC 22063]WDF55950.1 preprotein translocase subunit SecG [Mucilaginibacter sp. KACC 22063]